MKKKTIAMAWGGTGGHVFPIRSILATIFKERDYSDHLSHIIRFGSKHSLEQQTAKEFWNKITFQYIFSWKYRRQRTLKAFFQNLKDLFLFLFWFFQSLRYFKKYKVDTVFCKGGYVALPVVFAAKFLRKKIIVHESDVHSGLVNKIASKYASKTFTGFDNVLPKSITVGQILSDDIVPTYSDQYSSSFQKIITSIDLQKPTVFVMGGSQGSKSLYETFAEILKTNVDILSSFNFFITLWKLNNNLKQLFSQKNVHSFDFLSQKEMGKLYQLSDICLARGGTTSLAEQKLFNIKSIIVPIPRTHDQLDNGKRYVKHFDDILLDQQSPTFFQDLEQAFLDLKKFKKTELKKDILTEIEKAKNLIITELLK